MADFYAARSATITPLPWQTFAPPFPLKGVEPKKYKPAQIVAAMRADGYRRFNMNHHTALWQGLGAQDPAKGFGIRMLDGQWYWYENWIVRVRAHCEENAGRYR